MTGHRRLLAAGAFLIYAAAIAGSNWLISHAGNLTPFGTHTLPTWPGLVAPSGVYAAALSFPARDVTQRLTGRWVGLAAILVGALVSLATSSPVIAVASFLTYLVSEGCDWLVYTPLQRRWFAPAVVASGMVAAVVDSVLFLHLAHLPADHRAVAGLVAGKVWVVLAAWPVTWLLRNCGPFAVPQGELDVVAG